MEQDHRALVHVRRRVVLEGRCTQVFRTFNESWIEISAAVNFVRELDAHGALQGRHVVARSNFSYVSQTVVLIALSLSFFHFSTVLIVTLRFFDGAGPELHVGIEATTAGLFRPDILTAHTLIARTTFKFDRKLSGDRTLS